MRVPADEVPRLRARRCERVLDRLRHDVRVDARAALQGDVPEARRAARRRARPPRLRQPRAALRACAAPFAQIAVRMLAGSTMETTMPHGASSTRRTSANASSACFDAAYGPRKGNALRPPIEPMRTTRPRALPKRGQERLHDGDLADDVHLELAAELVERDELERSRDRDAGVVDEAVELAGRRPLRPPRSAPYRSRRARRARRRAPEAHPRLGGAHTAVDPPARPASRSADASPIPDEAPVTRTDFDELNRRGSSSEAPRVRARTSRAPRAPFPGECGPTS